MHGNNLNLVLLLRSLDKSIHQQVGVAALSRASCENQYVHFLFFIVICFLSAIVFAKASSPCFLI